MHRRARTLCCFLLLMTPHRPALTAAPEAGDGLLNGGFEQARRGKPDHWQLAGGRATLVQDSQMSFEGGHSALLLLEGNPRQAVYLQQVVEVEAATRYDLGGVARVDLDRGFAQIMVVFVNEAGA